MKKVSVLVSIRPLLAIVATLVSFGVIMAAAWQQEMAYTKKRQESYEKANQALHDGDPNPNRFIIRPPETDPSYYK